MPGGKALVVFRLYLTLTVIYVWMILAAGPDGTSACLNKHQALSSQAYIINSTPDLLFLTETICASIHIHKAF